MKGYIAAQTKAMSAVSAAIRKGVLADLSETVVKCSDCGGRAKCYDHRDYNKPLDVSPVCQSCNLKRGRAAFTPYEGLDTENESVSIKIDKRLLKRIRAICNHTGARISWVVNKAIAEWLNSREDDLLGRKKP